VVTAAEVHRQPLWVIENVEDFLRWELYPAWKHAMELLGYSLSPHLVDVADLGVPQNRERLFIIATLSKAPLVLDLPKVAHVPASTFIDFESGNWQPIHKPGRSKNTLARVASGRERFGEQFLAPYYSSGSGKTGRSLDRPIGTITTRDRWSVVNGDHMRMITKHEAAAAMGFPEDTVLPPSHKLALHMLGNAVPPKAAQVVINEAVRSL
jgi:DNA (cytosine-5)-methyltransferase 1